MLVTSITCHKFFLLVVEQSSFELQSCATSLKSFVTTDNIQTVEKDQKVLYYSINVTLERDAHVCTRMEVPGIVPRASRMRSGRSTVWATPPRQFESPIFCINQHLFFFGGDFYYVILLFFILLNNCFPNFKKPSK